ncbi:MAG: GNAT family N-acetyltransferase [Sulfurospirillum sp.]|nr:GNAT family N-acetyltransferase [Sulfurospirillum sp.]
MNLFLTVSEQNIASQIANLINTHNGWQINYNSQSILNSSIKYFVELNQNLIIGCIGLQYENTLNSRIIHLCVHNLYRRKGIGKKLVATAIDNCSTNKISTNIRNTNFNSLYLFYRLGFINESTFCIGHNQIICLAKTINKDINNGNTIYNGCA